MYVEFKLVAMVRGTAPLSTYRTEYVHERRSFAERRLYLVLPSPGDVATRWNVYRRALEVVPPGAAPGTSRVDDRCSDGRDGGRGANALRAIDNTPALRVRAHQILPILPDRIRYSSAKYRRNNISLDSLNISVEFVLL